MDYGYTYTTMLSYNQEWIRDTTYMYLLFLVEK